VCKGGGEEERREADWMCFPFNMSIYMFLGMCQEFRGRGKKTEGEEKRGRDGEDNAALGDYRGS